MNLIELNGALRQLRLGGMAGVLETRLPGRKRLSALMKARWAERKKQAKTA